MRNLITIIGLLLGFVLITKQNKAQYFAPVGAKWTYEFHDGTIPPYNVKPLYAEVIKDTIINGLSCRKIEIKTSSTLYREEYIRTINDSVLFYSSINNKFNLLYDFNSNAGDTLTIYYTYNDLINNPSSIDSALVVVDSVGSKIINGGMHRSYHQYCLNSTFQCPERSKGWVIDSLGMIEDNLWPKYISYLFPAVNNQSFHIIKGLRCYSDSNTNYVYENINCDTSYITNIDYLQVKKIKLYPTILSVDEDITIENIPKEVPIYMHNIHGIEIPVKVKGFLNRKLISVNSNNVASGIYFISSNHQNFYFTRKILIK